MRKIKWFGSLGLIVLLTACTSTQYPVGKRKGKRKKKCDCPDFGRMEQKDIEHLSSSAYYYGAHLSNLNEEV